MKNINWNELIWLGILFSFSLYLFFLITSGDILYYIHPRSIKFTIPTMIIFFILTIFQVKRAIDAPKKPLHLGYLIFVLPLILGITVMPQGVTEQIIYTRGFTVSQTQQTDGFSLFHDYRSSGTDNYITEEILVIEESFYDDALNDIKDNTDLYVGQKVRISGFIFRHDHFDDNTFFISRLLITCCAADALITGILAEYEGISDYDDYEWVEIQGVIDSVDYFDPWTDTNYEAAIIIAESLQQIEKPLYPYVYPSDYGGKQH